MDIRCEETDRRFHSWIECSLPTSQKGIITYSSILTRNAYTYYKMASNTCHRTYQMSSQAHPSRYPRSAFNGASSSFHTHLQSFRYSWAMTLEGRSHPLRPICSMNGQFLGPNEANLIIGRKFLFDLSRITVRPVRYTKQTEWQTNFISISTISTWEGPV